MLGNLRRVAMREEVVRPEIFVYLDEMRVALRILAGSGDAGLAVAHDTARSIDPTRFDQRPQPQNHGRGIAPGVSNDPRLGKRVRIKLRQAIHRLRQGLRVRRGEFVPLYERLRVAETECAAEVHDTERGIRGEKRGNKLQRSLVRSRKECDFGAAAGDGLNGKRAAGSVTPATQLREKIRQAMNVRMSLAEKECRLFDVWMPQQEPG